MTIRAREASQTPLGTDQDKVTRIRDLLAPASNPGQLWVLLLDGDGRQSPVLIPISELPELPDMRMVNNLAAVVRGIIDETMGGDGQVLFVVERLGCFGATHADHCWADALDGAIARVRVASAGIFLLSPGGVAALAPSAMRSA